jgi:hypothetical protein
MSGKGKGSRSVNYDSSDEDTDAAAGSGLTPENIWDGRVVVDRPQVESFEQDMLRVLLESEWLSAKIGTILDEGFDDGSRRLTHQAALRIADVLTPRHQEVSRVQEIYERRATTCPLCMISMGVQVVAFRHLTSEQHLLQVQRHHELRGWVKKVVLTCTLFYMLPTPFLVHMPCLCHSSRPRPTLCLQAHGACPLANQSRGFV